MNKTSYFKHTLPGENINNKVEFSERLAESQQNILDTKKKVLKTS